MSVQMSEKIDKLAAALAIAQSKVRSAIKDNKNPHLRNNYADLSSVTEACRDALTENGIAVVQMGERADDGSPWLRTILAHSSGQFISGALPLMVGEPKGISMMQALGSAITYARRYGLSGAGWVVTEDDDGHAAGHKPAPKPPEPAPKPQDVGEKFPNEPKIVAEWNKRIAGLLTIDDFNKAVAEIGTLGKDVSEQAVKLLKSTLNQAAGANGFVYHRDQKAFVPLGDAA